MTPPDPSNIFEYLMVVAPAVTVMGIACYALWTHNQKLTEKIYDRDIANLLILEKVLSALQNIEKQGNHNFEELRKHVSGEILALSKDLARNTQ